MVCCLFSPFCVLNKWPSWNSTPPIRFPANKLVSNVNLSPFSLFSCWHSDAAKPSNERCGDAMIIVCNFVCFEHRMELAPDSITVYVFANSFCSTDQHVVATAHQPNCKSIASLLVLEQIPAVESNHKTACSIVYFLNLSLWGTVDKWAMEKAERKSCWKDDWTSELLNNNQASLFIMVSITYFCLCLGNLPFGFTTIWFQLLGQELKAET